MDESRLKGHPAMLVMHPRFDNPLQGEEREEPASPEFQRSWSSFLKEPIVYKDKLCRCKECSKYFYFFALEQKYWYEELRIALNKPCNYCIDCRNTRKRIVALQKKYEHLQKFPDPTPEQIKEFRHVAKVLLKIGCIKDRSKVDKLGTPNKYEQWT